jgi:hypothetical protein
VLDVQCLRASSFYRASDYARLLAVLVVGSNLMLKTKKDTIFGEENGIFFWLTTIEEVITAIKQDSIGQYSS